ncbi:unnamed protein product [Euphydryas editha]|uniref:Secreted protein n=1 Tax=Euphydryas editha TaxID=104508 RepID=A0AAU9TFC9_EUPED|nr:unnamed protein product [Euphydryas editha]
MKAANITVLTTILLIAKSWRAVISLKILNCFKKSGFIKENQKNLPIIIHDEEPAIEPLVFISRLIFSDFVQVVERENRESEKSSRRTSNRTTSRH